MAASADSVLISRDGLRSFMVACMVKVGTNRDHAVALADTLIEADYRGHYSHGLNRLELYINDIKAGVVEASGEPEIVKETVATALVDGRNLLGPVVGNFCMDLAIQKAQQVGVGWVVARGSNHFGISGWYSTRALKHGFLGISSTNGAPFIVPTRAKQQTLGTNPLSVAAPANNGDSFVLDMATSAVAFGKVEMQYRKGEKIPSGWAMDSQGNDTTDSEIGIKTAALYPLGGAEVNSGYKGYGLSLMVDVLCGILSGADYGTHIRNFAKRDVPENLGQCFVALDVNAFAPGFENRLSDLLDHCRNLEPVDPKLPVLVAGDPEKHHMAKCDQLGGIPYHINVITAYDKIAQELGVDLLHRKPN